MTDQQSDTTSDSTKKTMAGLGLGAVGLVCLVVAATAGAMDGIQRYATPLTIVGIVLIGIALVLAARGKR